MVLLAFLAAMSTFSENMSIFAFLLPLPFVEIGGSEGAKLPPCKVKQLLCRKTSGLVGNSILLSIFFVYCYVLIGKVLELNKHKII